ncbi:MAG: hypothetical protein JSR97_00115 [Verrucomicrobia bacterium]|nr:hypothetical protein [Verrucomicrobiota bacterium]
MRQILTLLFNLTAKNECHCGEITSQINFSINEFYISVDTAFATSNAIIAEKAVDDDYDSDDDLRYKRLESIEEFLSVYPNNQITAVNISLLEYLGHREGSHNWSSDNEILNVTHVPNSFAKTILKVSREINIRTPEIFESYAFKTQFDDSSIYCGADGNYVATIFLNPHFLNEKNVSTVVEILSGVDHEKLGKLYWSAFFEKENIKNDFNGQFLNTNTKVRRLGYLKVFFRLLEERKKIPASFVAKKFEEFALAYSGILAESEYSKGIIQDSNGKSAEPYLSLIRELNLVETVNRLVVPSKILKVYIELSKRFNVSESANPFSLTEFDKAFFLEILLQKDYLYITLILELINLKEKPNVNYLVSTFQSALVKRLENYLVQNSEEFDRKKVNQIKAMKKRIEDWEKPQIYLEHVLMPRINWLADLGFLRLMPDNSILLLAEGKIILNEIFSWIDISNEYTESSTFFLKRFYPHIAGLTFRNSLGDYPAFSEIHKIIEKYIDESFRLFKTLAPNRVTSSQAFTFTKYSFFLNEKFCVTEAYLERIIQQKFSEKYIYKFQQRYGDGYIQKIQSK